MAASVAYGSCGCSISRSVQGQVVWDFEQPGPAEDGPDHGRELEVDDFDVSSNTNHLMIL